MNEVLQFRDTTENKMRRSHNELEDMAVDTAGYCAYAYQRGNCGMSVKHLKMIRFMSWSDDRIDAVETFYQKDLIK